ncbi:MAG: acyltransferase [Candidatus Obscuribacterales bacterium]|nr:acyltransferase [Steroidobacteraceae bacterium]
MSQMPAGPIPSLDGIRALAVSLVFFAHSGLDHIVPGGLGVTIFFVLSGYLISTLMRIEFAATHRIDYRGFYLRRFLRLMPPLFIVVALAGVLSTLSIIDGAFSTQGFWSVLLYFGNYFVIAHDFGGLPAGLGVVWSLAVEEHYYLFYPPLAALLLRTGRVGLSAKFLLTLCLAVLAWRCWLVMHGAAEEYLTMATDTRVDSILVGCLLALWRNPWIDAALTPNPVRDWFLIGLSTAVLLFTLIYRDDFFRLTYRYSLQSLAVVPLLYFAVAKAKQAPFCWLNAKPLVYIGTISYTVYLTHHAIFLMIEKHWPEVGWLVTTFATILITLAIAEPMRRWVELPCARLRKRLHKSPRTAVMSQTNSQPVATSASRGML